MIEIMEFKHHSPYNGCFWEWQYIALDLDTGEMTPIVWRTDKRRHEFPKSAEDLLGADYASDHTGYEWCEYLWKEIPNNHLPAFWDYAQEHDLEFTWKCDHCGLTTNQLGEMSGYHGNGGAGIEVTGWYCEDCFHALSCEYCGEINDPDSPWWDHDEDLVMDYDDGICPACHEVM